MATPRYEPRGTVIVVFAFEWFTFYRDDSVTDASAGSLADLALVFASSVAGQVFIADYFGVMMF